jgi:hypothetical protein
VFAFVGGITIGVEIGRADLLRTRRARASKREPNAKHQSERGAADAPVPVD